MSSTSLATTFKFNHVLSYQTNYALNQQANYALNYHANYALKHKTVSLKHKINCAFYLLTNYVFNHQIK